MDVHLSLIHGLHSFIDDDETLIEGVGDVLCLEMELAVALR